MAEDILDFDAALQIVLERCRDLPLPQTEMVDLLDSYERVLAADLFCDRDQPPFDRSTRDGFAVLASTERKRQVAGLIRAGDTWRGPALSPGDAVEIMTGAPLPAGADAVVMVEHVERNAEEIVIGVDRTPSPAQNIVLQGAEQRAGEVALPRGARMKAAEIATAASIGAATVQVYRRPRVAIIATGDELVELNQPPEPYQIRNSNTYALAALVQAAGGEPFRLPVARDTREDLERSLEQARSSSLILFSGGVSMGKYDLVETMLMQAGAAFHFTGVRMQPGKPVVFGSLPDATEKAPKPFFGLPGNPVSTQVTFHCFVAPLIGALSGSPVMSPPFAQATLAEAVEGRPNLVRLLPAHLSPDRIRPEVRLVPWQGSGDLGANARANCYAVFPPGFSHFQPGDIISILLR